MKIIVLIPEEKERVPKEGEHFWSPLHERLCVSCDKHGRLAPRQCFTVHEVEISEGGTELVLYTSFNPDTRMDCLGSIPIPHPKKVKKWIALLRDNDGSIFVGGANMTPDLWDTKEEAAANYIYPVASIVEVETAE